MKYLLRVMFVGIGLIFANVQAALVYHEADIVLGQGVDIGANKVKTINTIPQSTRVVKTDSTDLTYFGWGNVDPPWGQEGPCGGVLTGLFGIDSIYMIISSTALTNTNSPGLSDTTIFRNYSFQSNFAPDNAICIDPSRPWYITKIRTGQFCVFRFLSATRFSTTIPISARIAWYLQTDGSLNFSGAQLTTATIQTGTRRHVSSPSTSYLNVMIQGAGTISLNKKQGYQIYDLRGRLIGRFSNGTPLPDAVSRQLSQGMYFVKYIAPR